MHERGSISGLENNNILHVRGPRQQICAHNCWWRHVCKWRKNSGRFLYFFFFYVRNSTLLHLLPLGFRRILGSNPGLAMTARRSNHSATVHIHYTVHKTEYLKRSFPLHERNKNNQANLVHRKNAVLCYEMRHRIYKTWITVFHFWKGKLFLKVKIF